MMNIDKQIRVKSIKYTKLYTYMYKKKNENVCEIYYHRR